MTPLNTVITKILSNTNDFCCICFNTGEMSTVSLEDQVVVYINQMEYDVSMFDIFSTILGQKTVSYISSFDFLCNQCIHTAVKSYKFIKKVQDNSELVTKVLDGLTNHVETISEDCYDYKALYLTIDTENFITSHYCDTKKPILNCAVACKRLKTLVNTKNLKPKTNSYKEKSNKINKTKRAKSKISTEEMLDKKDLTIMKCKECLKVYPTIWNLRNHYIRVHAPKIYKCSECPRKYGSSTFLETHKDQSHCTIVCSECGKVFHNRHTAKMHELGHHMRLVCQRCGRVYKNSNTFKKHIEFDICSKQTRAKPSDGKFVCDYCNKKYTQKVSLRVHIQYDHGNYKSHDCKWCDKKFWCQSRLKAHIVKHTQEKNFHCTICKKNFVSKESLLYHTRIHTGERPYQCPECDSRFLSASRRAEHVKRHHSGATLECDVCQSKFNSQSFLQKHKRTHLSVENQSKNAEETETEKLNDGKDLEEYNYKVLFY